MSTEILIFKGCEKKIQIDENLLQHTFPVSIYLCPLKTDKKPSGTDSLYENEPYSISERVSICASLLLVYHSKVYCFTEVT